MISPLIALMKDQVGGIGCQRYPGSRTQQHDAGRRTTQNKTTLHQGKIKLLYLSPEALVGELHWLPRMDISLIAIDEAHCISHWGHDFRPEYTQLSVLKEQFPKVPIVALTATADKVTRTDICPQLKLRDPEVFVSSFDRRTYP